MASKPVETVIVVTEEGSETKKISTLYDTNLNGSTVDVGETANTDETSSQEQSEETQETGENPSVVVYIPSMEGNIASYNPDYILRKIGGKKEIKIFLPTESGTMARIEDIEGHDYKDYVKKQDLRDALEEAVSTDIPDNGYTIEDIRTSYNKLLQSLRNLIKEN